MNVYGFIFVGIAVVGAIFCAMRYIALSNEDNVRGADSWGGAAVALGMMFWVLMFCPAFYG